MDAPPVRPLAPEEIHTVVSHLVDELCRPVEALEMALATLSRSAVPSSRCSPSPSPSREPAPTMLAICQDLRTMTREFLQYVWIDRGGTLPRASGVRLSRWVDATRSHLAARPETAKVSCTLEGRDAEIAIDQALTTAVLDRLVDNAVRYSPPGTPVSVTARLGTGVWHLVVEDQGPGIPPQDRSLVLEPLTRLARDVKAEIPGSGLGLAVCRALVSCMGGTIAIEPGEHDGTRVHVELPRTPRPRSRNLPIDPVANRPGGC